ncbi:uncharacterized, partial [Tachysurus ichikawai]
VLPATVYENQSPDISSSICGKWCYLKLTELDFRAAKTKLCQGLRPGARWGAPLHTALRANICPLSSM